MFWRVLVPAHVPREALLSGRRCYIVRRFDKKVTWVKHIVQVLT